MSKSEETFRIGDLVEKMTKNSRVCGIILKKRFSPREQAGQKYTALTYDILLETGNIENIQPQYLRVVQKLK